MPLVNKQSNRRQIRLNPRFLWLGVLGLALFLSGCPSQTRTVRRTDQPTPRLTPAPQPRPVKKVAKAVVPQQPDPDADNSKDKDYPPADKDTSDSLLGEVTIPKHPWFKPFVKRWFKRNGGFVQAVMKRRGLHMNIYRKVLKERKLPMELLYVAAVESNFRPKARSVAKAVGVWQFISSTGRRYGLKINKWQDQRSHIHKSTVAAARYLTDLYKEFKQWELAFAGYNCGENCVRRVLRRCPNMSFWDMRKTRRCRIPRETRMYVPLIYALIYLERNPPRGYANIKMYPSIKLEKVTLPHPLSLLEVSSALSVSIKDVQAWNPSIKSWVTPPVANYQLLVPPEYKRSLLDYLEYPGKDATFTSVKVRSRGEFRRVARKYGMKTRFLATLNGIPRRSRRFPTQQVVIPVIRKGKGYWKRKRQWLTTFKKELRKSKTIFFARKRKRRRRRRPTVCHWVRPGDSYWHIGKYYNIPYLKLARFNRRVRVLRPGIFIKLRRRARCGRYRRPHQVRYSYRRRYKRSKRYRRSRYYRYRRYRKARRRYSRSRREPAYKKRWFYQVDSDFRPVKRRRYARRSRRSRRRYRRDDRRYRRSRRRSRRDRRRYARKDRRRRTRRNRRSRRSRRVASRYRRSRRSRSCHRVRRGDSLWKLSKRYKISYRKLIRYNRSKRIYVGRYVKLRRYARCRRRG